jgi:CHASE2 domain-containing sensor protein
VGFDVGLKKIQMKIYLIIFGSIVIGSTFWAVMQIGMWSLILRSGATYRHMKGFLIAGLICFTVLVEFIGLISALLGSQDKLWDLLIAPGLVAYAIGLSFVGLCVAQRVVGSKPKDQADKEAQQDAAPNP